MKRARDYTMPVLVAVVILILVEIPYARLFSPVYAQDNAASLDTLQVNGPSNFQGATTFGSSGGNGAIQIYANQMSTRATMRTAPGCFSADIYGAGELRLAGDPNAASAVQLGLPASEATGLPTAYAAMTSKGYSQYWGDTGFIGLGNVQDSNGAPKATGACAGAKLAGSDMATAVLHLSADGATPPGGQAYMGTYNASTGAITSVQVTSAGNIVFALPRTDTAAIAEAHAHGLGVVPPKPDLATALQGGAK